MSATTTNSFSHNKVKFKTINAKSSILKTINQQRNAPELDDLNNLTFFDQRQLAMYTREQKQWAQRQFRQIYSEEMSKVTKSLQNQQRIQANIDRINNIAKKDVQEIYKKLQNKMVVHEEKRKQKNQNKAKMLKQQEKKWHDKIQTIENKFKSQNKQAIEKAEIYRQKSQDYWKGKEKQQQNARLANTKITFYKKFHNLSKTVVSTNKNNQQKLFPKKSMKSLGLVENQNSCVSLDRNKNKYQQSKIETMGYFVSTKAQRKSDKTLKKSNIKQFYDNSLKQQNSSFPAKSSRKTQLKAKSRLQNSNNQIDESIIRHKEKSNQLIKDRQQLVFQNAMKRLAKIQQSRKKATKQPSHSPTQIRKPKIKHIFEQHQNDDNTKSYPRHSWNAQQPQSNKSRLRQKLLHGTKFKEIDVSIQNHILARRTLQEEQFRNRDKLIENEMRRTRQDKILKLIRNKVKNIKMQALKEGKNNNKNKNNNDNNNIRFQTK